MQRASRDECEIYRGLRGEGGVHAQGISCRLDGKNHFKTKKKKRIQLEIAEATKMEP